ncbi:MAG: DNA repair protein RecO [Candidatus Moranbacteria bacterium RBG_13_45_13]|nr:MAG: DNA repair protein RecO [Candidatus Moranbacteria bacterium RBG_13_45_13]
MQKFTSIILSSHDTNEFDRIYVMYTLEQGLVRAVAKGTRKPTAKLAGHLEPGTLSEVYIARARGLGQITGAITLRDFSNIKKDFEKLGNVLKIFRFFGKNFAEGEKDEKIFSLLDNFLSQSSTLEPGYGIIAEAFWWKLFDRLGQRPEVMKCVSCRKKLAEKTKKFFSVEKGGIVCAACVSNFSKSLSLTNNQIKLLRIFLGNSLEKIAKVKVGKGELLGLGRIRESFERYNF